MSKGAQPATTTTQQQIPQWLEKTLKPLLQGSTGRLLEFQNQGNAILQGKSYKDAVPYAPPARQRPQGKIPPVLGA
jgi:hypothetical protein